VAKLAVADTGPLIAIVRKREKAHKKCVAAMKALRPPLLTCWPVLTEAAWLLRDEPGGIKAIAGLVAKGSSTTNSISAVICHGLILGCIVDFRSAKDRTLSRKGCDFFGFRG
jgi:hypothetical protein